MDLKSFIHDVPDFPTPGINYKDITPLLQDPLGFRIALDRMAEHFLGQEVDAVVGIESRGFIFGAPLALDLGVAFVPARKSGKLPRSTRSVEFSLEYGTAVMEIHEDGVLPGKRVVIADDVLATGGTLDGARKLVEELGGYVIGATVLLELEGLKGRQKLAGMDVFSVLRYP
ncbi:MAG: adenine phosphoribosyltransferase [Chloroflexi bacterium]|nr:adenine phosphoribosyltransferase [Chloroflexota bacterium]